MLLIPIPGYVLNYQSTGVILTVDVCAVYCVRVLEWARAFVETNVLCPRGSIDEYFNNDNIKYLALTMLVIHSPILNFLVVG